jgi:membrane-associated phospholipid phosphatase
MSNADLALLAARAGAHALAWYLALLVLVLVVEFFAWPVQQRQLARLASGPAARTRMLALLGLGLATALTASACFWLIAHGVVGQGRFLIFDQAFLDALRSGIPHRMVKDAEWVTWFGDGRTLALLCIVAAAALVIRGEWVLTLAVLAAVGGNGLVNAILKRTFERTRPMHEAGLPDAHGWIFPSGHTSGAVVAYGVLAYVLVRTLPRSWHLPVVMLATALVFAVGWSRIVLEAHFASDVLGAFASGIAWLALIVTIAECRLRRRRPGKSNAGAGVERTEPRPLA